MRIERVQYFVAAAAIALQIVAFNASPYAPAREWDIVWTFLAYAGLTLMLWIGTDGQRPWLVPGAVMFLGAWLLDFAAAAPAVTITAGALSFFQAKPRDSRC